MISFSESVPFANNTNGHLIIEATEPIELVGIKCGAWATHDRMEWRRPLYVTKYRSIFRRSDIQEIRCPQTTGARHILRNRIWLARKEADNMFRQNPTIGVITTAGARRDNNADGFSFIKICDGVCLRCSSADAEPNSGTRDRR